MPYNYLMPAKKFTDISKNTISTVLDIAQSFVISFTIYILIFHFIAQPQRVVSVSMQPNFFENDRVIVEKLSYRFSEPKRGEVIVFKYPENEDITLIKRIIGLPGETLTIKDNIIYINDQPLSEPYLKEQDSTIGNAEIKENTPYHINPNEYLVMGDNRFESGDSRQWGPISDEHIIGRAIFRFWPPRTIGILSRPMATL